MLFDRRCPGCRRRSATVCGECRAELVARRCRAGSALDATATALGLDSFSAGFAYDGVVAELILAAKNGGRRDVLALFGSWLAVPLVDAGFPPPDLVTWVPASRRRHRQRGYDQGDVLARAVAAGMGSDSGRLLRRTGSGAQAGRDRAGRLVGPELATVGPCPSRVLLVDDVVTTGASLAAAAAALRAAGASHVHAAVVALAG